MVKQQSLMSKEKIHHCPVGCVLCNHPTDYPARFVPFALPASQSIRHISNKSNHILFLIDGSLHVVLENKNIYIQAGQALFFGRNTCPYIRATHDSTIVWLKFSNRIVLGGSDVLSKVAAANRPSHEDDIPILDLTQTMIDKLRGMQFIDSPCYHISRQYELRVFGGANGAVLQFDPACTGRFQGLCKKQLSLWGYSGKGGAESKHEYQSLSAKIQGALRNDGPSMDGEAKSGKTREGHTSRRNKCQTARRPLRVPLYGRTISFLSSASGNDISATHTTCC